MRARDPSFADILGFLIAFGLLWLGFFGLCSFAESLKHFFVVIAP